MDGTSGRTAEQPGATTRGLRTDRGMGLAELARQVHYTTGYMSRIETGHKPLTPEVGHLVDLVLETGSVLTELLTTEHSSQVDEETDSPGTGVCACPGLVAFGAQEAQ